MPFDLFSIPARLNYDTAVDWPVRLEREGPFLRRVRVPRLAVPIDFLHDLAVKPAIFRTRAGVR